MIKGIIEDIEKRLLKKSEFQAKQGERYIVLEKGLSSLNQVKVARIRTLTVGGVP